MAKKAKRKLEEEEEAAFEFPVFDDVAFVKKEFALTTALTIAGLWAVIVGLLVWAIAAASAPWYASFGFGILLTAATPVLIGRLRPTSQFTKGDWLGLIFLVFFGFLAIWLLLVDLGARSL